MPRTSAIPGQSRRIGGHYVLLIMPPSMTFARSSCILVSQVVSRYTLTYGINTTSGGRQSIIQSWRYFLYPTSCHHRFNQSYQVPEETVLSDPTGLHLGAGPYMLFYSRHLSEEELNMPLTWPKVFMVCSSICSVGMELIMSS